MNNTNSKSKTYFPSNNKNNKSLIITALISLFSNRNNKLSSLNWIEKNDFKDNLFFYFLLLISVENFGRDLISTCQLIRILDSLISKEITEGGPYASSPDNKNIDIGTNILIDCFLRLKGVELESLEKLIDTSIRENNFYSDYCVNPYFLIFLLSKNAKKKNKDILIKYLIDNENGDNWGNILNTSLAVISLSNLNYENRLDKEFKYLENNKKLLNNSFKLFKSADFEIETTLKLNASIYSKAMLTIKNIKPDIFHNFNKEEKSVIKNILKFHSNRTKNLGNDFEILSTKEIIATITRNSDKQMSLMPFYLKKALGEKAKCISNKDISQLGLNNIYFWNAFIIYDNFWDEDEESRPELLPIANYFSRNFLSYLSSEFCTNNDFCAFFQKTMDKLDKANFNEVRNQRFIINGFEVDIPNTIPDYTNYESKFWPSSGHAVISVAMLMKLNYRITSPEVSNLMNYFKNYLIAKQINDDLHDWIEDLNRGHFTIATAEIIKRWKTIHPNKKKLNLNEEELMLRRLFWESIDDITTIALCYLKKSRKRLANLSILEEPKYLMQFIEIEEKIITRTIDGKKENLNLINNVLTSNDYLPVH